MSPLHYHVEQLTIGLGVLLQWTCFNFPFPALSEPNTGGGGTGATLGGGGTARGAEGTGGACRVLYLGLTGFSLLSGDLSLTWLVYTWS